MFRESAWKNIVYMSNVGSIGDHLKTIVIIVVFLLAYIILIIMYTWNNPSHLNSEFGNYLSGIFAPISAIGSVVVTYLVYVFTSKKRRADDDFKQIANLFLRISEGYEKMKDNQVRGIDDNKVLFYERQLKTDSILMLNLIRRYPSNHCEISSMERTLMSIYVNPHYESDYINLTEEFQNFCYELNSKRNPNRFKLKKY